MDLGGSYREKLLTIEGGGGFSKIVTIEFPQCFGNGALNCAFSRRPCNFCKEVRFPKLLSLLTVMAYDQSFAGIGELLNRVAFSIERILKPLVRMQFGELCVPGTKKERSLLAIRTVG